MTRGPEWREAASQRVQQWTAMPLLVLSLLIIPILLIPNLGEPEIEGLRSVTTPKERARSHQGTPHAIKHGSQAGVVLVVLDGVVPRPRPGFLRLGEHGGRRPALRLLRCSASQVSGQCREHHRGVGGALGGGASLDQIPRSRLGPGSHATAWA